MSIPAAPSDGKYRVLVVEDDSSIARLILANLAKAGLECRYAPDGTTGFTAFKEAEPHLVLTDVMMPGLNGAELCAKIRETSTIPIIVMTAADNDERQMDIFKAGADDYVPKPFNPKLMVARVIANLRRVYRYNVTEDGAREGAKEEPVSAPSSIPAGWATCDACGYMGPRETFEQLNAMGRRTMICPHCRKTEHITFAIG